MTVSSFNTPLVKKEKNSDDAWNFYFEKPKDFSYIAGQYIKMRLQIENPDDRGVTRYFTLASSPTEDHLMITTRIIKSSFKLRLGDMKLGETVGIRGPWGDFTLSSLPQKPVVFIAGGIGMTPFRSMLKYLSDKNLEIPITLIVSYKTPSQILYKEELHALQQKRKNLKVITTITKSDSGWGGLTGRITTEVLQKSIDNLGQNLYYIAGPDPMMDEMKKILGQLGVQDLNLHTDGFPGYTYET